MRHPPLVEAVVEAHSLSSPPLPTPSLHPHPSPPLPSPHHPVPPSPQIQTALELFEWMVEGRGNGGHPVVADVQTYELLIKACHRRGLLEKGLEVLSWMYGAGLKPTDGAIEELLMTSEVAALWDAKALQLASEGFVPGGWTPRLSSSPPKDSPQRPP